MENIAQLQNKIKAWLWVYKLEATVQATGLSAYYIRKCANETDPNVQHLETLVKHFEAIEEEKTKRLATLAK